ncbi:MULTISPECIES: hypothetical protein [Emticicia]|nr:MULTISPECIES: hypothetical protein [Emticicia]
MKKQEAFLQSKTFRVLLVISIVYCTIVIFKAGYATGQWLFAVLN